MDETRDATGDQTGDAKNVPLTSCPDCAAQMPGTAAFCPGCGRAMPGHVVLERPTQGQSIQGQSMQGQSTQGQPVLSQPVSQPVLDQSVLDQPMPMEARAQGKVGGLPESIAGALAYFTFVPAVIFLLRAPFSKNRFVRFHSVQCLLLWVASGLFAIAVKLASVVLFILPVLGPLLVWLVSTVVVLAAVVIWVVLVVKAFQGEMFKLPLLGDFAAQQAGEL
jgi:uncharacterized membrane protein